MKETELNLALLISGGGSTMDALLEAIELDRIQNINPVAVISSRPDAGGLKKAKIRGLPTYVIPRAECSKDEFADRLLYLLKDLQVDLVSQNGWIPLTPQVVVEAFAANNMIINQHPGPLDPGRGFDFGGKGMYGSAVTCARLAYLWMSGDDPYTEATVHSVTPKLDEGDLISVVEMEITNLPSYRIDPSDLQKAAYSDQLKDLTSQVQTKLLPLEHENVITALSQFGWGEVNRHKREQPLVSTQNRQFVEIAKNIAINLYPKG